MSRSQGDNYKTKTNEQLNAYRARLDEKLHKLIDHKEKWYRIGTGWVLVEEQNRMKNPNGSWKWEGWVVDAQEYWIKVFPADSITIEDGAPCVTGLAQLVKVIDDDKDAANRFFKDIAAPIARNLKTWIPAEVDNKPAFEHEGRKPKATITMSREDYTFGLVVDGKEIMRSRDRKELEAEAEQLGAEM